jgi:DNA-binding IscR family transcriptional regulator
MSIVTMEEMMMNILNYLKNSSKTYPVKTVDLCKTFSITPRHVRDAVHNLRIEGYPVLASTHFPTGYFMSDDAHEIKLQIMSLQNRIDALQAVINGLKINI